VSRPAAEVVIIGGGILGLATAWHLAQRAPGVRVCLLERHQLASGATAQAAGLLTRDRADPVTAALVRDTYGAIPRLEQQLGQSLDLNRCGTLHLAHSAAGTATLTAIATRATAAREPWQRLSGPEAVRLAPWLEGSPISAAVLMAADGLIDPTRLALAYAAAARAGGVELRLGVTVRGLALAQGRVVGVETDQGRVSAPTVVLAGGAAALALAAAAGITVPAAPVQSEYWISQRTPSSARERPVTVLPEAGAYLRPEVGALLLGLRGVGSRQLDPRQLDAPGAAGAGNDPWATLSDNHQRLLQLLPCLGELGLAHYVAGWSTYTPDGRFVLGPAAEVAGVIVLSGCCGAGIAASSGLGRAAAALALGQSPGLDLTDFAPGRFGAVSPLDPAFRARCAAARSHKTGG